MSPPVAVPGKIRQGENRGRAAEHAGSQRCAAYEGGPQASVGGNCGLLRFWTNYPALLSPKGWHVRAARQKSCHGGELL